MITVSAVIPTRNRVESLRRLLMSMAAQVSPPREVIVVDASDDPRSLENVLRDFRQLPLTYIREDVPSVCRQRNRGIAVATSTHVFLCDDDVELPPRYIALLTEYLEKVHSAGAASGVVQDPDGVAPEFARLSFWPLLWRFCFQLGVWGRVDTATCPWGLGLILAMLQKHYRRRGNRWTYGGWPLVTSTEGDLFMTAFYGLGASVIRKEWLIDSPFDESLEPHGIGENYGVALHMPGETPIHVMKSARAVHHRESINRPGAVQAYRLRILALHRFMYGSSRFTIWNRMALRWSLVGNLIAFTLSGNWSMAAASGGLILRMPCI